MFLQVSVILSTGGGRGVSGEPPWTRQTPPDQGEPPRTKENPPDQADPPGSRRTPPDQGEPPLDQADPPRIKENPPPREEDCSIRSMSGRYASYWNAILFPIYLLLSEFYRPVLSNIFFRNDDASKTEKLVNG